MSVSNSKSNRGSGATLLGTLKFLHAGFAEGILILILLVFFVVLAFAQWMLLTLERQAGAK